MSPHHSSQQDSATHDFSPHDSATYDFSPHDTDYDAFLGAVDCTGRDMSSAWFVHLPIASNSIKFKIDTGADVTVMSKAAYNGMKNPPPLQNTQLRLNSPGGMVCVVGEFTAETVYKDITYKIRVFVASGNDSNLLSRETAAKMGLVKRVNEVQRCIGLLKTSPVHIHLRDDSKPVCIPTARRIPFPLFAQVEAELMRMVQNDVISRVPDSEPTDWCSAMVPVIKKTVQSAYV